ncbi:Carbohydrate-binding module family 12 protein [Balamuthia mandrillaris]
MSWVSASGGSVPSNALVAGYESDGKPIYIGRAQHQGGVHPGKVAPHLGGCNIGYGGQEHAKRDYEVYCVDAKQAATVHWQKKKEGKVPPHALPAGREADGQPLWVARTKHQGGLHIGKAGAHLRDGMSLGFGGREINKTVYEVLVHVDRL